MAGAPFQIPGLGDARPNEQLPAEHFAPDLIAAAASISDEKEVAAGPTNGDAQLEKRRQDNQQQQEGASTAGAAGVVADGMDLDITDANSLAVIPAEKQDADMQDQETRTAVGQTADDNMDTTHDAPSPDVTFALEAALDGMLPQPAPTQQQEQGNTEQQQDGGNAGQEEEHPEWEADSSPYESSSESSSSDSDSDDDSEDEGGYQLLGIEETARLLMAADGDGDGDGDGTGKSKGTGAALRTKNEIPDEVIPKPDITITPEMKIEPLGNIQFVVETTIVIQSQLPGEVQVLDSGSVLCKEDRTVIGALAEVLGNVRSPMYTVGFASEEELNGLGLVVGMPIFYSVEHANYVFTQPLKAAKGTDASNLHDEEVPAEEMEFSDDEKEAEYKKQQKLKRRGGKAGRGGRDQSAPSHTVPPHPAPGGDLNYDDDEDGPYKPLARPPGYGQSLPSLPPRPETGFSPPRGGRGQGHRGSHRGGRGDFRGRNRGGGHRGGDRRQGSRGGGSGSYAQFGRDGAASPQTGFVPLPPPQQNPHLPPPPFGAKPPGQWPAPPTSFAPPPMPYSHSPPAQPHIPTPHHQPPTGTFNFNYQAWTQPQAQQQYQYPPQPAPHHQHQHHHHQNPPTPHTTGYVQPYAPQQAPAWPAAAGGAAPQAPPAAAAGAYNPAYYQQAQQQAQQQQQQQGQQYWPHQQQQQQHGAYGQGQGHQ